MLTATLPSLATCLLPSSSPAYKAVRPKQPKRCHTDLGRVHSEMLRVVRANSVGLACEQPLRRHYHRVQEPVGAAAGGPQPVRAKAAEPHPEKNLPARSPSWHVNSSPGPLLAHAARAVPQDVQNFPAALLLPHCAPPSCRLRPILAAIWCKQTDQRVHLLFSVTALLFQPPLARSGFRPGACGRRSRPPWCSISSQIHSGAPAAVIWGIILHDFWGSILRGAPTRTSAVSAFAQISVRAAFGGATPMEPWGAEHRAARRRHSQSFLKV